MYISVLLMLKLLCVVIFRKYNKKSNSRQVTLDTSSETNPFGVCEKFQVVEHQRAGIESTK